MNGALRILLSVLVGIMFVQVLPASSQEEKWTGKLGDGKSITKEDLASILDKHKIWIERQEKEGERAIPDKAELRGAFLIGANLSNAELKNAKLSGANLSKAILEKPVLTQADLQRAKLSNADLNNAKLSGANLRRANLQETDLTETDLYDDIFDPTDLINAKGFGKLCDIFKKKGPHNALERRFTYKNKLNIFLS